MTNVSEPRSDGPPPHDPLSSRYPWCVHDTAAGQAIIHSRTRERIHSIFEAAQRLNDYDSALRVALPPPGSPPHDAYEQAARWCEERAEKMADNAITVTDRNRADRILANAAWVRGCADTIRQRAAALSGPPPGSPPPSPLDVLALARVAARRCGYALAVHGSLSRDIDLVAVPWTDEATEPAKLVERIREAVGGYIMVADDSPDRGRDGYFTIDDSTKHSPVERAHGRLAWSIYGVLGGSYIDLSVMPLRAAALSGGTPQEHEDCGESMSKQLNTELAAAYRARDRAEERALRAEDGLRKAGGLLEAAQRVLALVENPGAKGPTRAWWNELHTEAAALREAVARLDPDRQEGR